MDPYDAARLKTWNIVNLKCQAAEKLKSDYHRRNRENPGQMPAPITSEVLQVVDREVRNLEASVAAMYISIIGPDIDKEIAAQAIWEQLAPLRRLALATTEQQVRSRINAQLQLAVLESTKDSEIVSNAAPSTEFPGSYQATVINVMIASPGDVPDERNIAREEIHRWNDMHSETRGIVLMPKRWEEHSSPLMGDRAQVFINTQVLENCALLVAIFWTRIGTPTGDSPSGTVEEIEHHITSGKPAMLYFSNTPVPPDNLDRAQYDALTLFRDKCKDEGLVEFFDSLDGFRNKFSRQLAQTINRYFSNVPNDFVNPPQTVSLESDLSIESERVLSETSECGDGTILFSRTNRGLVVKTNRTTLFAAEGARLEANWNHALEELQDRGFLEALGTQGSVFKITKLGYEAADRLTHE